jgi:O-antigen/teichoic acid export membrane protein
MSTSKLKVAVLWSYLLTTGSMLITGVLTFVLAAILDPESFGVLALGMLWVGFAQMLLQHGPTLAIIQLEKVTDEQADAAFWVTIGGALLFGLTFGALAPLWGALNNLPGLAPVSWALIGVTLLTSITVIPDALLRRELKFKPIAIRAVVGNGLGGVVGVIGALSGWGVWALVVQQVVAYAIFALSVWTVTPWRPSFPRPRRIFREMKSMRRQSIQTLGGAVGVFLANRMDVLLMGAFFGPVMVGLYRFALRLAEMVIDVTSRGLQQVSLPELAQYQSDRETLSRRLANLVHVAVVMSLPALAVLAAIASPLVRFIGPQWADAAGPLRLLCMVSAMGTINGLLGPAMQAVRRASVPAILTWVAAGLSAVGLSTAAWLSRGQGTYTQLTAVASAALIIQAIMLATSATVAYRFVLKVSIVPTLRVLAPAVVAAVAGFVMATAGQWLAWNDAPFTKLALGGLFGGTAALGVLGILDGPAREQAKRVLVRLRRRTVPASDPA